MWRIVPWISFRFLGQSIESHFFSALDLYDFRIMDDNFHGTETQLFQRLLNGLFYAVKRIVFHDGLSPFCVFREAPFHFRTPSNIQFLLFRSALTIPTIN